MKKLWLVCLLVSALGAKAQFSVRLVVTDVATRKGEDIYVSGNFNNWNPRDENYKLKPFVGGRRAIVLKDLAAGTYVFRFTRGAQEKVESTADGRDIPERVLEVTADASQEYTIAGWKDDYPDKPKPYTASPQVRILDTAFAMPQLARKRRIWIYLPKGYATASKTYPVMYMHDGQNLFNEQTATAGEWGVDETLDTLQQKTGKECIIVGIDSDKDRRNSEYAPYDDARTGKAEGDAYLAFIVNTLKPYIDSKYRTKKGPESTFITGSARGALISFYGMIKYPAVFGGSGILSPSFSASPQLFADAEKYQAPSGFTPKFYLYAGKSEPTGVADNDKMAAILQKRPGVYTRVIVDPLGKYNEASWRQEFPALYRFLLN